MTIPKAGWRAPVRKGDRLRISGTYENRDHAWYAVMSHAGGPCEREEPDLGPGVDTQLVTIQNFAYTPGGRGLPGQLGAPARVKQGQSLTFVNAAQGAGIRLHGDDLPLAMQWSLCGELPDRRRALGLRDARLRPGRWRQPDP